MTFEEKLSLSRGPKKVIFFFYIYILKEGKRKQTNAGFVIRRLYFMLGFFYMFIVHNLLLKPPIKLTQ